MADSLLNAASCNRCDGRGWVWQVPYGFNPFNAGGWATARACIPVSCYACKGSGFSPKDIAL